MAAGTLRWALSWPGLGPCVLSAANVQDHVAFPHQPGKPRGEPECPLRVSQGEQPVEMGARQPRQNWGFDSFNTESVAVWLCVCVCVIIRGCSHPHFTALRH